MTCSRSHREAKESMWRKLEGLLGDLEGPSLQTGPECISSSTGRAVMLNGVSVRPPKVYTGPGLSLRHTGLFLLLTTRLGLTLLWDGGQSLTLFTYIPGVTTQGWTPPNPSPNTCLAPGSGLTPGIPLRADFRVTDRPGPLTSSVLLSSA
jgi:hypothetical protein